ncbi:MAG: hypothetical protein HQL97_00800, partial [Magnetococcales bacterium]|nr:hypothetical protein [Magnetococcales bacterium]
YLNMTVGCISHDIQLLENNYNKISNKTLFFGDYVADKQRICALDKQVIIHFFEHIRNNPSTSLDIKNVIHAAYIMGMYHLIPEALTLLEKTHTKSAIIEQENFTLVKNIINKFTTQEESYIISNKALRFLSKEKMLIGGYSISVPPEQDSLFKTLAIKGTPACVYAIEDRWLEQCSKDTNSIESIFFEPWPAEG